MLDIQQKGNMEEYINNLKKCILFKGIESFQILPMLECLNADIKEYKKNQLVFKNGDKIDKSGIVLKGELQIVQYDYFGNRSILSQIGENQLFGVSYSLCDLTLPICIEASQGSLILFINVHKIITPCKKLCQNHLVLIRNLLSILSMKNISQNQKIECLSKRTTREKILNYLTIVSMQNNSKTFKIPYNRQELADYLCVERSAMSAEIGKLQKEGFIKTNKNYFEIC